MAAVSVWPASTAAAKPKQSRYIHLLGLLHFYGNYGPILEKILSSNPERINFLDFFRKKLLVSLNGLFAVLFRGHYSPLSVYL